MSPEFNEYYFSNYFSFGVIIQNNKTIIFNINFLNCVKILHGFVITYKVYGKVYDGAFIWFTERFTIDSTIILL